MLSHRRTLALALITTVSAVTFATPLHSKASAPGQPTASREGTLLPEVRLGVHLLDHVLFEAGWSPVRVMPWSAIKAGEVYQMEGSGEDYYPCHDPLRPNVGVGRDSTYWYAGYYAESNRIGQDCLGAAVVTEPLTDLALGDILRGGVALRTHAEPGVRADGLIVDWIRFDGLTVSRVADPALTPACATAAAASIAAVGQDGAVLVLEVLTGEVTEHRCGLVRAKRSFKDIPEGTDPQLTCETLWKGPTVVAIRPLKLKPVLQNHLPIRPPSVSLHCPTTYGPVHGVE